MQGCTNFATAALRAHTLLILYNRQLDDVLSLKESTFVVEFTTHRQVNEKKMHNSWSLSTATNKQAWTGWISKSKWPEKMDNFARPNRILRIMADIFIEATLSNAFATCWLGRKENVSIRKFQTKLYCSQQKLVDFATQNFDVSIHWSLTSRTRK